MSKAFTFDILKSLRLPEKLATVKVSILGQPERGKTYTGGVFAEELLEHGCQTIILDSVGVWYGLRLAANGKGKGYDIHIFGGEHGDLPLIPTAGAVLAETLVRTRKSAIIDTTGFATEAEQRRFMADFAETFYRLKMKAGNKGRVTLILEEADDWIPQMPEASELRMLGAFQRIARKGRNFGIGLLVISQRPQGVHKKVLNLSDVLFVFGISGKHERKAIREWTEYNEVDEAARDKAMSMLPGLKMGQCLVWAPRFGIFGVYNVRKKWTLDASATPDGDEASAAAVRPLNTDELAKAMAATVEEAKANDPRALKARVAELEAEMSKRGNGDFGRGRVTGKTVTKTIEVPVLGKREAKTLERIEKSVRALTDAVVAIQPAAAGVAKDFEVLRAHVASLALVQRTDGVAFKKHRPNTPFPVAEEVITRRNHGIDGASWIAPNAPPPKLTGTLPVTHVTDTRSIGGGATVEKGKLPKGEDAVLRAVAQSGQGGATRQQITTLTGYKRRTRDQYIVNLKHRGCVDASRDTITATAEGVRALGDFQPLPTGDALLRHWYNELPRGEAIVLSKIVQRYPHEAPRDWLTEITGYKRRTRDQYIVNLKSLRLVEPSRSGVRASAMLFDNPNAALSGRQR